MDKAYRAWRAALYLICGCPDIPDDVVYRSAGCSGYSNPYSLGGELDRIVLGEELRG